MTNHYKQIVMKMKKNKLKAEQQERVNIRSHKILYDIQRKVYVFLRMT